jgi:hypothetical protein
MSNQVVVPFRAPRSHRRQASSSWSRSDSPAERPSRGWINRLATARDMVRAVVETLSYLGDARVRPSSPPALPPKRESA